MMQVIIGALFGVGLFFILADVYAIPYYKTSKAVESLSKLQKEKTSGLDLWLGGIAGWLADRLPNQRYVKLHIKSTFGQPKLSWICERETRKSS